MCTLLLDPFLQDNYIQLVSDKNNYPYPSIFGLD